MVLQVLRAVGAPKNGQGWTLLWHRERILQPPGGGFGDAGEEQEEGKEVEALGRGKLSI